MKKLKIISLILTVAMLAASLSSCLFFDAITSDGGEGEIGDVTVNVGEVNNHDVNITSSSTAEEIAADKALMSSVSIRTEAGAGSGVIFKMSDDKSTAYVLTNYHVVYNASTGAVSNDIKAYLYGMESQLYQSPSFDYSMRAYYLGGSMEYDLAVLKISASSVLMGSVARACDLADSNKVRVLETAIAVGNAGGQGISVTMGKINVESEDLPIKAADNVTDLSLRVMRTDAAVNSGNSGGGLFNAKGELIGIVCAKSASSTTDNMGYAIPSNLAKYVADNIIYYCDNGSGYKNVYKCLLGINVQIAELYVDYDSEAGELVRKERIKVSNVMEYLDTARTKPGAAFGILAVGDVINSIKIDGTVYEVTRLFHVTEAMLNARVTSQVVLNVTRGAETIELTIPLNGNHVSAVK